MILNVAIFYSRLYGFFKDLFGINIRGLGFILRRVTSDTVLCVDDKYLYFDHRIAEAYARPLHGKWNEPETHAILAYLQKDIAINFIEVGANIGEILVDVPTNPNCISAVAFEPNPIACSVIKENLKLNKIENCILSQNALGHQLSKMTMFFGTHSPTASLLSVASKSGYGVEIDVSTLDSELLNFNLDKNIPLVFLIDVEGYELNVVKGGRLVIGKFKPIVIIEFHRETKLIFNIDEMRTELGPNYSIFRLRSDGYLDSEVENAWNCVAIPMGTQFEEIMKSRIYPSHRSHSI